MRASLTKSLGIAVVVASSLVLSLPGSSVAQASPKKRLFSRLDVCNAFRLFAVPITRRVR